MLKLKNITKDYSTTGEVVTALKGISVEFRKNEFVAILGHSGCGKTTLLNIIGGLDRYTSGDLIIDNVSTLLYKDKDWDTYRNHSIGFVFQSYNLIMHQTVFSNVELALTLAGTDAKQRKARVMAALEKVGIADQANRKPNQLSGGQMQRVAIARAIINDPEILLADEPTGALDSDTSIQIMEILKDIAKDRLVIMVTHNPEIAENYATRIIKLTDGLITEDSMPYTADDEQQQDEHNVETIIETIEQPTTDNVQKEEEKPNKPKSKQNGHGKKKHSSMSILSALKLSLSNLITKRGRAVATAVAGSIGIIGIALVLAISTGFSNYISTTEENALCKYPLVIEQSSINLSSILEILYNTEETDAEPYPDSNEVTISKVFSKLVKNMADVFRSNDLESFKTYLDENFDDANGSVKYSYNTVLNIYSNYVEGGKTSEEANQGDFVKINPFTDRIDSLVNGSPALKAALGGKMDEMKDLANSVAVWDELIDNQDLLNEQYELIGNSKWPSNKNELVVVVNKYNQIDDYLLFALGLKAPSDLAKAISGDDRFASTVYTVEDLLNVRYRVLANSQYYVNDGTSWNDLHDLTDTEISEYVRENGEELKVVGVVRPRKNAPAGVINGVLGYTSDLANYIIDTNNNSPVMLAQKETPSVNVLNGKPFNATNNRYDEFLIKLGSVNKRNPNSIYIYAKSFETKDNIIAMIDDYNAQYPDKQIKYTDMLSLMISSIKTILDAISYVLIAFSSISLIVSSIMISIITYTSVLEREKEIGILRSVGARKKDISLVFITEAVVLGFVAGVIGVCFTALMCIPINVILSNIVAIEGIAHLGIIEAIGLVLISTALTLIAGFIPSRVAAQKDPVKALRSGD